MSRFACCIAALATGLALVFSAPGVAWAEHKAKSPAQLEMEETIHQYLIDHPEVIVEVLRILRQREQAAESERLRASLAAHREALLNDPTSPVFGNPDGDVTLVEFFDYHCTYCKRSLDDVNAIIESDPGVRVVYKEFPVLGPDSVVAARAALASRKQDPDKYFAFHNAMMSSRGRLTEPRIMDIAAEIGFDTERLKTDMAAPDVEETIQRNLALAEALGIGGTPTFIIGDELIPGAAGLNTFKRLIARARSS